MGALSPLLLHLSRVWRKGKDGWGGVLGGEGKRGRVGREGCVKLDGIKRKTLIDQEWPLSLFFFYLWSRGVSCASRSNLGAQHANKIMNIHAAGWTKYSVEVYSC